MLVMGNMIIGYSHLTTADAGTDVAHTVVEANLLVLVIWITFPILSGVHHYLLPFLLIIRDEGSAATRSNHLVAVEAQHAVLAEGTQHLAVVAGAEAALERFRS